MTAAGTDVSGLTLAEAAGKLYNAHGFNARPPAVDARRGPQVRRSARATSASCYDVNKSARRAYNAGLKPHTATVDVPLFVTYDATKVTAYATKVAADVKRDARDARVDIKLSKIGKVASRDGRTIDADGARHSGRRRAQRSRARTRMLKPKLKVVTPEGHDRRPGEGLRDDHHDRPRQLQAAPVQAPEAVQDLRRGGRHAGVPDADRPLHASPTRPSTRPGRRPNSPWAGAYANETVAGGSAREPAQGALDGDRQRRRHPRHRRTRARSARAPRTAASA